MKQSSVPGLERGSLVAWPNRQSCPAENEKKVEQLRRNNTEEYLDADRAFFNLSRRLRSFAGSIFSELK